MEVSGCYEGIEALKKLGICPIIDTTVQLALHDQLGLNSDLCKLQHRCAYQGTYNLKDEKDEEGKKESPALLIDNKEMGTLDDLKVDEIKALAQPSPFGRGSKTVHDEKVRKALEIKGDRIQVELDCPEEVQKMAPMGYTITAKLYKLAIYEKDGFFAEHSDTSHGDNHLGTLVVCLPVPHKGGTFILSDDENELKLPFDEMVKGGKMPWVAFYTDVKHKVEVVKSGVRMTLQYDLMIEKEEEQEQDLKSRVKVDSDEDEKISATKYYFQDYNQEIVDSIKEKLNAILKIEKGKKGKGKVSSAGKEASAVKKRDRPDDDEPVQTKSTKQSKKDVADSEAKSERKDEAVDNDDEEKARKKDIVDPAFLNPNGIAIMLKRRYGAASLSVEKLKGSDSVLYEVLKDSFRVEVKQIILEQGTDYEGEYNQTIEAVALSDVTEAEEAYTSDEESTKARKNKKNVPKKVVKKGESPERKKKVNKGKGKGKEKDKEKVKTVCLVSGYSSKSLLKIVSQEYLEYTGNEAQEGVQSYLHAALFIYPK